MSCIQETFICFLQPTRDGMVDEPTEQESLLLNEHAQYLLNLCEQGVVILAGSGTDPPPTGIVILKTRNREEAQSIVDNDPAVRGGVFQTRLSSFKIAMMAKLH